MPNYQYPANATARDIITINGKELPQGTVTWEGKDVKGLILGDPTEHILKPRRHFTHLAGETTAWAPSRERLTLFFFFFLKGGGKKKKKKKKKKKPVCRR